MVVCVISKKVSHCDDLRMEVFFGQDLSTWAISTLTKWVHFIRFFFLIFELFSCFLVSVRFHCVLRMPCFNALCFDIWRMRDNEVSRIEVRNWSEGALCENSYVLECAHSMANFRNERPWQTCRKFHKKTSNEDIAPHIEHLHKCAIVIWDGYYQPGLSVCCIISAMRLCL